MISIHFSPLLPEIYLWGALAIAALLAGVALYHRSKHLPMRAMIVAAFIFVLCGPSLLEEERTPVRDVAAVIIDNSSSQSIDERETRTARALVHIKGLLGEREEGLELRVLHAPDKNAGETMLFSKLRQLMADVPASRRAGVIIVSDGQIHDIPENAESLKDFGPVHLLLSGERDEIDRRVRIIEAPAYGITKQDVVVKFIVEDFPAPKEPRLVEVTLRMPNGRQETLDIPSDVEHSFSFNVPHRGENVFEIAAEGLFGEITNVNNHATGLIKGVRDRLKVLLVSGVPHSGGRTWRDLLTSDAGVDLVHFTILRDISKVDATPQKEMSLIAFPFRELFETKLNEFDLVILDRYRLGRILPRHYFANIAEYVRQGGGLLVTSGEEFTNANSIYYTPISEILPASPAGNILRAPYRPRLSKDGRWHPVTANLAELESDWGHWQQQIPLNLKSGDVLMQGIKDHPLLILNRLAKGRVAQISSDQIWLWARGYDGGGPHTQLLRRIVHWLMKEPELDETALDVQVKDDDSNVITVRSYDPRHSDLVISMRTPLGEIEAITLNDSEAQITAQENGLYTFETAQGAQRSVYIGASDGIEMRDVITTPELMKSVSKKTKGGVIWLEDNPTPDIRLVGKHSRSSGQNWIGLKRNGDYDVSGTRSEPLLPAWMVALWLLGLLILSWWLEGRRKAT